MGVATARTVTLDGIRGHVIDVQADVRQGLVNTTMVGRPDPTISESRDRCRTAIVNSRFEWPTTRRVTIALSPADLPKRGSHFDLAIALAVLTAGAREEPAIPVEALAERLFIGELTLDGRVRAVHGVIPMVMAARARGVRRVVVPDLHVAEAALVPDVEVEGVRSLGQAVALLMGDPLPDAPPVEPLGSGSVLSWRGEDRTDELDLADVHGMADARYALEVAAAGGHHLLLSGPKGAGKTTLAERLPGLLPDLSVEETLELVAVQSLAGEVPRRLTDARPPFRAPHHSASKVSVLGGGTGRVHPGEISRALHGVLLLDEFPLFRSDIVDALRQPLESAEITITRGDDVATFPARSIVVLGANPCPCGDYSVDPAADRCTCGEVKRRNYRDKFSAPVKDRIDIERHVMPVRPWEVGDPLRRPEDTATVRARVEAARARQAARFVGTAWRVNADVPGPVLSARWPLTPAGLRLVDLALTRGGLTRRGATRVHRMAWTVADLAPELLEPLADGVAPGAEAVEVALRLRSGEPLAEATLEERGMSGQASEEEREARVRLNVLTEPGDPRVARLLAVMGPQALAAELAKDGELLGLREDVRMREDGLDPAGVLARADAAGIRYVVPGDAEWPEALARLDHVDAVSGLGGQPLGLWVRGPLRLDQVAEGSVAVVGSRSATTYGTSVAGDLAAAVAVEGRTVVSGAAFGIDQAAHRGALGVGGPTVAVLACGVDRAYPSAHRPLLDHLAQHGAVLSELRPGLPPTRVRFLARNRVIAALSSGTVVVEAAVRSGALNTANWASRLGRVLMGVPGPVTSAPSEGVHELLRSGAASLVTRGEHVVEALAPVGTALVAPRRAPERATDAMDLLEMRVLDAVPLVHAAAAVSVAHAAGLSVKDTTQALHRLRAGGLVQAEGALWRRAPQPE